MIDLKAIHKLSYRNRDALSVSPLCGCFGCLRIFSPTEITEWVKRDEYQTAICPYCESDTVLPSSQVELTVPMLQLMGYEWLGPVDTDDPRVAGDAQTR